MIAATFRAAVGRDIPVEYIAHGTWTAGQFFVEKAYILLVFAGIWALTEGITDIVRAFQLREVRENL